MNLIEAKCEIQDRKPPKVPVSWFVAEAATAIALAAVMVQIF